MDFCAALGSNQVSAQPLITFLDHNNLLPKQFFIFRVLVKWTKKRKSAGRQDQNFSVYFPFHASRANSSSTFISRLQLSLLRR